MALFIPKFKYKSQWLQFKLNGYTQIVNDENEPLYMLVTDLSQYKDKLNLDPYATDWGDVNSYKLSSDFQKFENYDKLKSAPLVCFSTRTKINYDVDPIQSQANYDTATLIIEGWKSGNFTQAVLNMKHENKMINWLAMAVLNKFPYGVIPISAVTVKKIQETIDQK